MKSAWMFPGHGAQYVGMGRALLRSTTSGPAWLAQAEAMSGLALQACMERGPLSTLTSPIVLEPLIAAVSGAYICWLREQDIHPFAVAGYSAGEVGAMYAANVFDAETCLHIACIRGKILERAALERPGGMISVSGLHLVKMASFAVRAADTGVIDIAGYNSPLHITLSGEYSALESAASHASVAGARVGSIHAAGPWHTRLMESARDELDVALSHVSFAKAQVPVWTSAAGSCTQDPARLKRALSDSLCNTVRWTSVMEGLLKECDDFLEVGPGRMLWGLLGQYRLPPGTHRRFIQRAGATRLKFSTLPNIKPSI